MEYLMLTHILEMIKQRPINFHSWLMGQEFMRAHIGRELTGLMWLTPRGEV